MFGEVSVASPDLHQCFELRVHVRGSRRDPPRDAAYKTGGRPHSRPPMGEGVRDA